jgi:hypothetical protein
MKTILHKFRTFSFVFFASCLSVSAQQYVNGTLSTGPISYSGVLAPAGYTWSETQHDIGNTTITNGREGTSICYGSFVTRNRSADDFVVPQGQIWDINNFEIFAYDADFNTSPDIMPLTSLGIEIWNGPPQLASSTKLFGNLENNVLDLSNSGEAMMYSIGDSTFPPFGSTDLKRKIWKIRGNIDVTLPAGTYWVTFQGYNAVNEHSINIPLCKYPGSRGRATNATGIFLSYDSTWYYLNDLGWPYVSSNPQVPQDLPFTVNYDLTLSNPEVAAIEHISIYPNPVQNEVEVNWSDWNITMKSIVITDIRGVRVNTTSVNNTVDKTVSIDLSGLPKGFYFLRATDSSNQTVIRKIVME